MSRFIKFSVVAILATISFSACSSNKLDDVETALGMTHEEVVQKGFSGMSDVKSGTYEATFEGTATLPPDPVLDLGEMNFSGTFGGSYDNSERNDPKLSFKFNGKLASSQGEQSVDAELRVVTDTFYFVLSELTGISDPFIAEMIDPYMGKWYSVLLPDDFKKDLSYYSGDESQLSDKEKELKELLRTTKMYKDVEYLGTEEVNGIETYHYSVVLDKEATKIYIKKAMELSAQDSAVGTAPELDDLLSNIEYSGEFWIGKDDMILHKSSGDFTYADGKEANINGKFTYMIDNINGPVDVDAPEGAEEFKIEELLGFPVAP